jgi:hypothetical protein
VSYPVHTFSNGGKIKYNINKIPKIAHRVYAIFTPRGLIDFSSCV